MSSPPPSRRPTTTSFALLRLLELWARVYEVVLVEAAQRAQRADPALKLDLLARAQLQLLAGNVDDELERGLADDVDADELAER